MFSNTRAAQAFVAVLSAAVAAAASAQTTPAAQPASQPKCVMQNFASLALRDDGLTISTDGSVNGDKAAMLIDSGASNTMVTQAEAIKLGLKTSAASGKRKKATEDERVQLSEFAIGSIEMGSPRILASKRLGDYPTFGALVGADFLMQHDMELYIGGHQLKFFNPVGCDKSYIAYWDANAGMVPMTTLSADDRRPIVPVEVDGLSLHALVDSAAPVSVMSLSAAARAGVTTKSPGVSPMQGSTPGAHAA